MTRLRNRFPSHRLLLCAGGQVATLLLTCRIVDAWTSVQGRACADLFAGSVTGQLQTWLEDCDLAIGWLEDADGKLSGALKAARIREVIVRSPFSLMIHATHQCDRFLEVINEAPYDGEGQAGLMESEPLLSLGQACLEAAGLSSGQPFVVIHPGSGSVHKCVAPEILASVVAALQHSGMNPVILEGPADREPVERLFQACRQPPVVLKGLDILTVAGVLAHARFFLGQDSGVTHMAGLLGVRTVALFGPTDPNRWAPRGTHVTIVQGSSCLCRSWGDVRRCEEQPCLKISQKDLVSLCLAQLREAMV
jgi:heptosyltransferase-3